MTLAGTMDALMAGASIGQALRSGFISGVSAAAFAGIGRVFANGASTAASSSSATARMVGHITAHAAVGGITEVARGGKFGHGFLSAGITKGVFLNYNGYEPGSNTEDMFNRLALHAVVGGTSSKISGGKFANGAKTAAFQFLFNEMSRKLRYSKTAKNWRQAEQIETRRQQRLKGQTVIRGQVGASYDGDNYIGKRIYDVVTVDESGHWTLTEVKFRHGRMNRFFPFKSYHIATIYGQSEFDYEATNGLTLTGKGIPEGSITLSPDRYSIQWVMMNDKRSSVLYPVDIGNEDSMYMNVMRASPYDEKWWD